MPIVVEEIRFQFGHLELVADLQLPVTERKRSAIIMVHGDRTVGRRPMYGIGGHGGDTIIQMAVDPISKGRNRDAGWFQAVPARPILHGRLAYSMMEWTSQPPHSSSLSPGSAVRSGLMSTLLLAIRLNIPLLSTNLAPGSDLIE
jgi:hypothetical protein